MFDYAKAVVKVSIEKETFLIDLHDYSKKWIIKKGRDNVCPFFYPGDLTHTNDYGAFFFGEFIAKKLKEILVPKEEVFNWNSLCPSNIPAFLYEDVENFITIEEAYKIVRITGKFFYKNEEICTNRSLEIICAEQNGYKIFEDRLDNYICENDFLRLLGKVFGHEEKSLLDIYTVKEGNNKTISRSKVIEYLEIYEDKMNFARNKKKHYIAGS